MTGDTRFEFGENWTQFLRVVDESRIDAAVQSLQEMLGVENLEGKRFLDVGSGSGLFSLAANRLHATVHSFDYDPQSVACTREMQGRFAPDSENWSIDQGSALDDDYLRKLGTFDVVYSWGVLHHTGEMWNAIESVQKTVTDNGQLFIAIYNDQGKMSDIWSRVKKLYQRFPGPLRWLLVAVCAGLLLARKLISTAGYFVAKLCLLQNPFASLRSLAVDIKKPDPRGMNRWYDLWDWVGGWPFEVAKPEEIVQFLRSRGFVIEALTTCGGKLGCNEFVFRRVQQNQISD